MSKKLTQEEIEQMVFQSLNEYGEAGFLGLDDDGEPMDLALGVLEELSSGIEKTFTGPTKNSVEAYISSAHGKQVLIHVNEFLASDYSNTTPRHLTSLVRSLGSGTGTGRQAVDGRRNRMLKAVQYFYGSIEDSDKNGPQGRKLRLLHILLRINAGQIRVEQLDTMSFAFLEQVLKPVSEISFEDIAEATE